MDGVWLRCKVIARWQRRQYQLTICLPCSGPKSMSALQKLTDHDLSSLKFGYAAYVNIAGVECHVARGGYTGEDGFEVSQSFRAGRSCDLH